jgi:hypothetical protein
VKCPYCNSEKSIKHGKTSTGSPRYRCQTCCRTWVDKANYYNKPDLAKISEQYLNGSTFRELAPVFHTSPLRINQKIRSFLHGCPNWEDYLDTCINIHKPSLIYLVGKEFSASKKLTGSNSMYLALAVDALSTVVLGFQIAEKDSINIWSKLLARLHERKVICNNFMSNGSKFSELAINEFYPNSNIRIFYNKAYRDKELYCCVNRLPINYKLVNDAVRACDNLKSDSFAKYLKKINAPAITEFVKQSPELFIKRLKERLDNRPKIRVEGLINGFRERFEKFHMIKTEPEPLINGWLSKWMLQELDFGFNRLSIYLNLPCSSSFKDFSCGNIPTVQVLHKDSKKLNNFAIEIATRNLQLPIYFFNCELNSELCEVF